MSELPARLHPKSYSWPLRRLVVALLWAALAVGAPAEPRRVALPEPMGLVDRRCVTFAVLQIRPESPAFQAMLKAAWARLQGKLTPQSGWLGLVNSFLSASKQQELLLGFLPFQGVRVDRLDAGGLRHSALMVTLTGWPGLQGLFWGTLLKDDQGRPVPTREVGGNTVVLRPDPGQPLEQASVLCRVKGTLYSMSSLAMARYCLVERKDKPAQAVFRELDTSQDTYGVVFNRGNNLVEFFSWLDRSTVKLARASPGFAEQVEAIDYLSWTGEAIDADHLKASFRIRPKSPGQAHAVNELLGSVQKALKSTGRAQQLKIAQVGADVTVEAVFVGIHSYLMDYLQGKEPI